MSPRCVIKNVGLGEHFVAEILAETLRRVQIHSPTKNRGEFVLLRKESQTCPRARLEFDQNVNVAVWSEVVAKDRTEQGQSADVVPPTEVGDLLMRKPDSVACGGVRRGTHGIPR